MVYCIARRVRDVTSRSEMVGKQLSGWTKPRWFCPLTSDRSEGFVCNMALFAVGVEDKVLRLREHRPSGRTIPIG